MDDVEILSDRIWFINEKILAFDGLLKDLYSNKINSISNNDNNIDDLEFSSSALIVKQSFVNLFHYDQTKLWLINFDKSLFSYQNDLNLKYQSIKQLNEMERYRDLCNNNSYMMSWRVPLIFSSQLRGKILFGFFNYFNFIFIYFNLFYLNRFY
jgi:hypothetical protein